jgi:hypothetical protein
MYVEFVCLVFDHFGQVSLYLLSRQTNADRMQLNVLGDTSLDNLSVDACRNNLY